jgi:alpha-D-ribose 1-methylphosphonate 5-triphosphate diphosphatase PhnM
MSSFLSDPLILHHPLLKQASLILVDMIAVDYYSLSHVEQKDYIHSFINAIRKVENEFKDFSITSSFYQRIHVRITKVLRVLNRSINHKHIRLLRMEDHLTNRRRHPRN